MSKKALLLGLILTLTATIILTGCGSHTNTPDKQKNIKIGFTGPLSGDAAIIGEENLNGIKLAIEKINLAGGIGGRQVELIARDDQLDEKKTISNYKHLTGVENIDHILAVAFGGFIALGEQPENDKVILINSLDSSEELANLSKNSFALGVYNEGIGYAIADYLNKEKIHKTSLLVNMEDPFILLLENSIKDKFDGKIHKENFSFDTKNFQTILTKLAPNKYIVLLGWEETGHIVKQARELGLDNKFIGIDTFASQDFRDNANGNYEGLEFTFWQGAADNQVYQDMLKSYQDKYNKQPENVLFVVTGYDAMMVLGEALKNCRDNTECTANYLRNNIKDFAGATGKISIDSDGITRSVKETMHVYQDGEIKEIK